VVSSSPAAWQQAARRRRLCKVVGRENGVPGGDHVLRIIPAAHVLREEVHDLTFRQALRLIGFRLRTLRGLFQIPHELVPHLGIARLDELAHQGGIARVQQAVAAGISFDEQGFIGGGADRSVRAPFPDILRALHGLIPAGLCSGEVTGALA